MLHRSDGRHTSASASVPLPRAGLRDAKQPEQRRGGAFTDAILAATPDIILVSDLATGATRFASRSLVAALGHPAWGSDGCATELSSLIHPEDRERVRADGQALRAMQDQQVHQARYRARHADGQYRWLSLRITPFRRAPDGRVVEVLSAVRDVTQVVAAEDALREAALQDPLTGLPNRTLLADRLTSALARATRSQLDVAVLYVDLDGFKRVNDSAGHAAGDAVLVEAGRRIVGVVRPQDTVARVGGDEFVIIVESGQRPPAALSEGVQSTTDRDVVVQLAQRIIAEFARPVTFRGLEHVVTASIGVAFAHAGEAQASVTAEDLLRDADAAMYRAKQRGKDGFEVFEDHLRTDRLERDRVERALRSALTDAAVHEHLVAARREGACRLDVAYQPVFNGDTGLLAGFEALARLQDGDGALISPEAFIPVAEDTGLIRTLGRVVLERSCQQLADWRRSFAGLAGITMAVNLSARQAQQPQLVEEVVEVLERHGLLARDLVLELTESVLLEAAHSTLETFRTLRAAGVRISIDDFGTGYASLRYLTTLPVTAVKVDRSFTAGLLEDPICRSIVRAVAGLAADLQLECVVEGVETEQQRRALPSGVFFQGWLLGRPALPGDTSLDALLAQASAQALSGARTDPAHILHFGASLAERRDLAGEQRDHAGEQRDQEGQQRDQAGERRDLAGDQRDEHADERDRDAEQRDRAADQRDRAAEESERGAGRTSDSLSRSALARRDGAADRRRASDDRRAGASERSQAELDRDTALADRGSGATERSHAGLDRNTALADRGASAQERVDAAMDGLTGVYLRGAGFRRLEEEIARARAAKEPLVVAFVDVDSLKAINDARGHSAGDRMLRAVAQALRAELRPQDLIIRYGGDEFVCALTGVDLVGAERRLARANAVLAASSEQGSVTVGLAQLQPEESCADLVARADAELYRTRQRRGRGAA